jgi:hypothetical protein
MQYKVFVYNDGLGITTIGRSLFVLLEPIIGLGITLQTILLKVLLTIFAFAAGVNQATRTGQVSDLEPGHLTPNLSHSADNFVSRDHRKNSREPVIFDLVQIGMTNTTK